MKISSRIAPLALAALAGTFAMGCSEPNGEVVGTDGAHSTTVARASLPKSARDATSTLKAALAKDSVFSGRLGQELATLHPLLTDAEVIAYQQKYAALDPVVQSERNVSDAAVALRALLDQIMLSPSAVMHGVKIRILAAGARSTTATEVMYGPKQIYDSYQLLSRTSEGAAAAAFADRLLNHDPALKAVWSQHSDTQIIADLGAPGILKAVVAALAALDKAAKASPIDDVRAEIGGTSKALSGVLATMTLLGDHEVDELTASLDKTTSPIAIALAVWQVGRDANNAHWKKVLKDLLALPGAAVSTLEFAEALDVISASSRLFKAGESISKLAGGLGVLMQTITLVQSLDEWNKSTGTKVAIVGNAIGALASVLALCGVAGAGPVGVVVGLAAGIIGPALDQAREDGRQNKDKEAVLVAIGWPSQHARNVARAQGRFINALSSTFGFSRTETLDLIDLAPEIAHGDITDLGASANNGVVLRVDGLITLQRIFGDTAARGLIQTAIAGTNDPKVKSARLEAAFATTDWQSLYTPVFNPSMSGAAYRAQFPEVAKHVADYASADARPAIDAMTVYVAGLR